MPRVPKGPRKPRCCFLFVGTLGTFGLFGTLLPCIKSIPLYNPSAMKTGIHPEVFAKAVTTCSTCGAAFPIPTTVQSQQVEICRMCHPVYTGKQAAERKGGRIERFRKRMAAGKK